MPTITRHPDAVQWDQLIQHSTSASPFQERRFLDFLNQTPYYEGYCLGVEEEGELKGVVVAMIQREGGPIKRQFTQRAIIHGGPVLAADISQEALQMLLVTCCRQLRKRAIYIETRNYHDYAAHRTAFASAGFRYMPHYDFHLPIDDEPEAHYHKNRLRNLRYAQRTDITIDENPTLESVAEFYNLLQILYHTKVHTPLPHWKLFESAYHLPNVHYITASDGTGRTVGGIMVIDLERRIRYLWYVGSDLAAKGKNIDTLLYHAAIKQCQREGIGLFDFMGGGKPGDGHYGVRDFKARWGADLVEYGRFIHIGHPLRYLLGRVAVKMMKRKR